MTLITQEVERRDRIGKAYIRCASCCWPDSETSYRGRLRNRREGLIAGDTQFWALSLTVSIHALHWIGPSFFSASAPMVGATRREDLVIYDEGGGRARGVKWQQSSQFRICYWSPCICSAGPVILNWTLDLTDPHLGNKPPLMSQGNACHIRSWNCPGEPTERLTSGHTYHRHWRLQALVSKITPSNIVPVWISKMGQNHPLLFSITMENIQGVLKITTQDRAVEGKENVWKNLCFSPFGHQRMLYWRELKDQAVQPTRFPDKKSEAQKQMGCLL